MSMRVYTIADDLSISRKLTPDQKKARKEKVKKGGEKFLWGIAFVNLAPIRGAFASILAMNVNAFANNMGFVYDNRNGKTKEEWKKIQKIWKRLGGIEKALIKGINIGRKHKPLFLSKKAKARFEKRQKAQGIKGIYIGEDGGIGVAAPVIAAAITAASGVIAAMIPAVMQGLKKGGQNQAAEEVAAQGVDAVQEARQSGYSEQAAAAAEQQIPEETLQGIGQAPDWSALTTALGEVAKTGITAAGNAIAKRVKNKPKAKKFLEQAGGAADDYFTGRYLRESGMKERAQQFKSMGGNLPLYLGIGAAAVLGGILLLRKK